MNIKFGEMAQNGCNLILAKFLLGDLQSLVHDLTYYMLTDYGSGVVS